MTNLNRCIRHYYNKQSKKLIKPIVTINIGGVYKNMGEYSKALSSYERALEIRKIALPPNHTSLATSYNNIGGVYDNMDEYSEALSYYEFGSAVKFSYGCHIRWSGCYVALPHTNKLEYIDEDQINEEVNIVFMEIVLTVKSS